MRVTGIFRQLTANFGRLPEEGAKKIPAFPGFLSLATKRFTGTLRTGN